MSQTDTPSQHGWYRDWGKRTLDIIAASALLLLLSPALVLLAIAVRIVNGRPVLFCQLRRGINGRIFTLLKFRSMTERRDSNGELLPDEQRVTFLGRVLRATSIDELPELWNVLRGEMSLVGPRPLLVDYWEHYTSDQRRRHDVRPGITGLAQIRGRNNTTWGERFANDVSYVDRCSLTLDCVILARTLIVIFRSDGGIGQIRALGRFSNPGSR